MKEQVDKCDKLRMRANRQTFLLHQLQADPTAAK
jgi:hypothetical protein